MSGSSSKSTLALPRGNACVPCRARKVKCSAERPTCSACAQSGKTCVYAPPPTLKSQLQSRVQELQDQLYALTVAQMGSTSGPVPRFGELTLEVQALRPPALSSTTNSEFMLADLRSWTPGSEMPLQLRSNLLQVFIRNQPQFSLDLFIPRIQQRIVLPTSHPGALHPAFLNALYLAACSCFGPGLEAYEGFFLQTTRDESHVALGMMDRLDQYFAAQILEANYLLRVGRLQEAYLISSTLLRFAIACELNTISNPSRHLSSYPGLLGKPVDVFHAAEHINLWWSCCILARRVSTVTGLHDGLDNFPASVTTVFPVSFAQVERMGLNAWSPTSARDLFTLNSQQMPVESSSKLALSAKAFVITAQFHNFLSAQSLLDANARFQAQANIVAVIDRVLSASANVPSDTNQTPEQWSNDPALLHVQVDLFCASLGLNQRLSEVEDDVRFSGRLRAARGLARLARAFRDSSRIYTHIPLACPMLVATNVLIEALQRSQAQGAARNVIREFQNDLFSMAEFLSELPSFFPQLPSYLSTLIPYIS